MDGWMDVWVRGWGCSGFERWYCAPWQCRTCTEEQEKLGLFLGLLSLGSFSYPLHLVLTTWILCVRARVCLTAEFSHCAFPDI